MRKKLTRWMVPVVLGALALSVGSLASASANNGFNKHSRLVFIEKSTAGTFVDVSGILTGGQIRVAGASTDANVNVLAVTGGTGIYRNVSGQITIETIDDNTSKDTLELTGVRR